MKTKKKTATKPDLNTPSREPPPDAISSCAYFIWEQEGRPHGRDVVHWLQAEAQIRQRRQQDSEKPPAAAN